MTQETNFKAKRYFLSAQQQLNSKPEKIFPLLCPTREYDWIETWKCELICSESGFAELDCIFTTHFPGDEKETWVVDRYEPNKLIEFIRVCQSRVIRYSIELTDNKNGTTSALWKQTITTLNEAGDSFAAGLTEIDFNRKIMKLEQMLNHYLTTGEMLRD